MDMMENLCSLIVYSTSSTCQGAKYYWRLCIISKYLNFRCHMSNLNKQLTQTDLWLRTDLSVHTPSVIHQIAPQNYCHKNQLWAMVRSNRNDSDITGPQLVCITRIPFLGMVMEISRFPLILTPPPPPPPPTHTHTHTHTHHHHHHHHHTHTTNTYTHKLSLWLNQRKKI